RAAPLPRGNTDGICCNVTAAARLADQIGRHRTLAQSDLTSQRDAIAAALPSRLGAAGLTIEQTAALAGAVRDNPAALCALHVALEAAPGESSQALWMLLADFAAAA